MNMITQEARKRQAVVKLARRKGKSFAARMYGVSLSSVKRWISDTMEKTGGRSGVVTPTA